MEEFKLRFIETAYTKFGIKAIESINFEQAFAILDEMQQCNIANVSQQRELLLDFILVENINDLLSPEVKRITEDDVDRYLRSNNCG